jgi:hypothetical protein
MEKEKEEVLHKLIIRTVEDTQFEIPYNKDYTGKQVKLRIKSITGTPVNQLVLVYRCREIGDKVTLSDAGIPKDNIVFVIYYNNVFYR